MKKEYINEAAWSKILIFLRSLKSVRINNQIISKRFIEAVYWMARTGAQWRMLPIDYGKWNSVFK
jgi:transposase